MISSTNPDKLVVQEAEDEPLIKLNFIRNSSELPDSGCMPLLVIPRGLTPERQWYLFEKIREYCPDASKDMTCPLWLVPLPSTPRLSSEPVVYQENDGSTAEELIPYRCILWHVWTIWTQ